jgi:iron complex transport system substrate-binding protein
MATKSKSILLIIVAAILLLSLFACTSPDVDPATETFTVTDQADREVDIEGTVERIVSGYYISSSVCIALGLTDRLVGIEARAETRPIYELSAPELLELPNVGTARDFNLEACLALEPDLVILPYRLRDAAETMSEMGVSVILVNPESYADMIGMIELIGTATGTAERATQLIDWLERTRKIIDETTALISDIPEVYIASPGDLLSTASDDMFQSELIAIAGGHNAASGIRGSGWTEISYEQLLVMSPAVILIASEADYDADDVFGDSNLSELPAVANGHVYKMPFLFEAWDSPVPASLLGAKWLLNVLLGEQDIDSILYYVEQFYSDFYGFSASKIIG